MRATVDDVHHRHGQRARHRSAEVAIERQSNFDGGRACGRHRHTEQRVRAKTSLVLGPVEIDHRAIDRDLIRGVHVCQRFGNFRVHVVHRTQHTLAAVARRISVTQFDRLALARAGAARHRRTARAAGLKNHVNFDGGIAARIEDLAGGYGDDGGHGSSMRKRGFGQAKRYQTTTISDIVVHPAVEKTTTTTIPPITPARRNSVPIAWMVLHARSVLHSRYPFQVRQGRSRPGCDRKITSFGASLSRSSLTS